MSAIKKDKDTNLLELENPNVAFFDVDETLLLENIPEGYEGETVTLSGNGVTKKFIPNKKAIERIKLHKLQGHTVIVWSHAGYQWSEDAVKKLNLSDIVDLVMVKPKWIYDDLMPQAWSIIQDLR